MTKRRLITLDWALKRLLRSKANYEVLEGFLSELLKDEITILEILESEGNKLHRYDKQNRLDIKVKNQKQEIMLIEVQYEREFDYLQRILYATSKAITEHLHESNPYADVVKVISINILYFDLGDGEDYIYHGKTVFTGIHKHDALRLSAKQQELFEGKEQPYELFPEYYLLKINQFDGVAKDTLDEWIYFLKNEEIRENFSAKGLKKAKEVLDIMHLPYEERAAYERYADDLRYQASMYQSTYVVGHLEGRKEGRAEGREEGRIEEKRETARKLKALGCLSVLQVAEATGLSELEIKEL